MRLLAVLLLFRTAAVCSVGFQQVTVPDPEGKPLAVAIWYPSRAPASAQPLEMFTQRVAPSGAVSGPSLPLVLISHGTGGSLATHYDTALALAESGFIAAAVTHTGDNYRDQSYVATRRDLTDRPRQMRRVLDYLLEDWRGREQIDPARIGIFGFSLGGFTALVAIGGTPELARIPLFCSDRPNAPECQFIRQRRGDQLETGPFGPQKWARDARIRTAVIAAPAVAFTFGADGLRAVKAPVQLWRADGDQLAPDEWNSKVVRDGLPVPPDEHVVRNAGHMVFCPCNETLARVAAWMCQDAPGFDRDAFHREFNQAVIAFFRKQLS
jgi:predicted dienelactone hydrolase